MDADKGLGSVTSRQLDAGCNQTSIGESDIEALLGNVK